LKQPAAEGVRPQAAAARRRILFRFGYNNENLKTGWPAVINFLTLKKYRLKLFIFFFIWEVLYETNISPKYYC
jgi:hypothetical protein